MKSEISVFKTRKLLTLIFMIILLSCFTKTALAELTAKSILDNPPQHYSDIACSNDGLYVIVGDYGLIKTSKDLKNWSVKDPGIDGDFTSCSWGNDKLVVATKYGVILCSDDNGQNWTITETDYDLGPVTWCNGKFFTVADGYNLLTSSDGVLWNSMYEFKDMQVGVVKYLNDRYVVYGWGKISVSQNGTIWTTTEFNAGDIIWDGKQYLTIGYGTENRMDDSSTSGIWTSQDALKWTKIKSNVDDLAFMGNITFFKNKYYATVSREGFNYVISSNDLKNWAKVNEKPYTYISKFLSTNNKLCALGYEQSLVQTDDGRNWQLTQNYKPDLLKVLWNGSVFLAFGKNGTVTLSEDGENWSEPVEIQIDGIFRSAIWTGREFYVATTLPNIEEDKYWVNKVNFYKSADGKAWTYVSSILDNNIDNIFYTNNRFFAVSTQGTIFSSTDCVNYAAGKSPGRRMVSWNRKQW